MCESDRGWLMETIGKADDGNREAMEMLDGLSGRRAEEIGAGTLDRMAAEGSPWAMFLLGRIFDQRGECEDNSCVAMGLYQDAADRMNPYAMVALAKMFERGDCVVKSFHNAYIQYKHAASLGCPPAERWMAENGELGRCQVNLDMKLDNSESEAMYQVGLLHEEGDQTELSYGVAFSLYMMSALKGYGKSALKVAECLMDGKGVPANRGLALRILVLMADNGDLEAQDAIRSMTDYELADCDGEELRSADFPEESWGREVMERIGTVG